MVDLKPEGTFGYAWEARDIEGRPVGYFVNVERWWIVDEIGSWEEQHTNHKKKENPSNIRKIRIIG